MNDRYDHGPGCDGPLNCTCDAETCARCRTTLDGETAIIEVATLGPNGPYPYATADWAEVHVGCVDHDHAEIDCPVCVARACLRDHGWGISEGVDMLGGHDPVDYRAIEAGEPLGRVYAETLAASR